MSVSRAPRLAERSYFEDLRCWPPLDTDGGAQNGCFSVRPCVWGSTPGRGRMRRRRSFAWATRAVAGPPRVLPGSRVTAAHLGPAPRDRRAVCRPLESIASSKAVWSFGSRGPDRSSFPNHRRCFADPQCRLGPGSGLFRNARMCACSRQFPGQELCCAPSCLGWSSPR